MYVGSLCEVVLTEASKDKKKKLSDYDKFIKINKKAYGGKSDGETIDRVGAVGGATYGMMAGGLPGAAIGAGAGYLGTKAFRKAKRWLDT